MKHLTAQQFYAVYRQPEGVQPPAEMIAHLRECAQCRTIYISLTREESSVDDDSFLLPCEHMGDIYLLAIGQLNLFHIRTALGHLDHCADCKEFLRFLSERDPTVYECIAQQRIQVSYSKYGSLLERGAQPVLPQYLEPLPAALGKDDKIIPAEGILRNGKRFRLEFGREQGTLTVEYFTGDDGLPPPVRLIVHDHNVRLGWSAIVPREDPKKLVLHFNANDVNIIHIGAVNQTIETFPYSSLLDTR